MVLHGKHRTLFQPDAAICPVEQADMGFGNRIGQCFAVNGKAWFIEVISTLPD